MRRFWDLTHSTVVLHNSMYYKHRVPEELDKDKQTKGCPSELREGSRLDSPVPELQPQRSYAERTVTSLCLSQWLCGSDV